MYNLSLVWGFVSPVAVCLGMCLMNSHSTSTPKPCSAAWAFLLSLCLSLKERGLAVRWLSLWIHHCPSGLRGTLEPGAGRAGRGSETLQGLRLARHGRIPDNWHPPRRHLSVSPVSLKTTATKAPLSIGHGVSNPQSTKTPATDSI